MAGEGVEVAELDVDHEVRFARVDLNPAETLEGRNRLAAGDIVGPAGDEHLTENPACATPGDQAHHGTGQGVGAKDEIAHHRHLEKLEVGDASHVRGADPGKLVLVDGVVEEAALDLEGHVVMELGTEHQSRGKAWLEGDVAADAKIGIIDRGDEAQPDSGTDVKGGEGGGVTLGRGCSGVSRFLSGQGGVDQFLVGIEGGGFGGEGMNHVVSPAPGVSGNEQKAEHTPSAHGLTLGAALAASSAYQTGKKERVNRLGSVTKDGCRQRKLGLWRIKEMICVWTVFPNQEALACRNLLQKFGGLFPFITAYWVYQTPAQGTGTLGRFRAVN